MGKTALIRRYVQPQDRNALVVTGEDVAVRECLESQSSAKLKAFGGWRRICPDSSFEVVHPGNYLDFIVAPAGRRVDEGRAP